LSEKATWVGNPNEMYYYAIELEKGYSALLDRANAMIWYKMGLYL
jgi:hypothetical protein